MGILRDILDLKDDIKDTAGDATSLKGKIVGGGKRYSSISKMAQEGMLYFPVLVSDTSDIETLQMICKALERNYADFVMIAISLAPGADMADEKSISEYLRKFHQNSDTKMSAYDFMNNAEDLLDSSHAVIDEVNEHLIVFTVGEGYTSPELERDLKINASGGILAGLNESILNDAFLPKNRLESVLEGKKGGKEYRNKIDKNSPRQEELKQIMAANAAKASENTAPSSTSTSTSTTNTATNDSSAKKNIFSGKTTSTTTNTKDKKNFRAPNKDKFLNTNNITINNEKKPPMDFKDLNKAMLTDNDVKKSNELVPTMLHINVHFQAEGKSQGTRDAMIGVKANMHLLKSEDMVSNLVYGIQNRGKFFQFLKWTTGEISFFKDFLFNVSSIKRDVVNRSHGASPWWNALKRRKALSKASKLMFSNHSILPNSTIVISMEEVNQIKFNYGFDFMNEGTVMKIMSEYFLLGFVVIDHSTQIAHFLFDGRTSFDSVSFSGLEKENSNDSKKFKEMLKAINRN